MKEQILKILNNKLNYEATAILEENINDLADELEELYESNRLEKLVSDEVGGQEDESDKKCQQLESMGKKTFDCGMPATHYCFDTKDYYCSEHAMIAIIAGLKQRSIFKKS